MLDSVRDSLGYGYSALTISRCRLVSAAQIIGTIDYRYELCKEYFDRAVEFVSSTSKPGDIVLIGPRSLMDKPDSADMDKPSDVIVNGVPLTFAEAYKKSLGDMSAFAHALAPRGVAMVFIGRLPQFGKPASQCVPEWFRMARTSCEVPIERSPALEILNSNVHFWDHPIAFLCGKESCSPSDGKRLLFRDDSHLSVYGSKALAPAFMEFLKSIELPGLR